MADWLTLQEYSNKQGISISTLRRKIKGREIEYILENGRYLLKLPAREEDRLSKEELKSYYKKLLNQKEQSLQKLKEEHEDLKSLLDFLEKEKVQLLEHLKDQAPPPN